MDETNVPPPIPPEPGSAVTTTTRTGLPWENREALGLVKAFTDTLMMVLTKPGDAFASMRHAGGFGGPLLYAVIGGVAGFLIYFLYMFAFPSLGAIGGGENALAGLLVGTGFFVVVILSPIFIVVGLFIWSAILHLCLMLVGGAKQPFETTFRVVSFSAGSTYPLLIIPLCGGFISGIWNIVAQCIGISRAHEVTTGKAVLAVLLPLIVCCGGSFALAIIFGVAGALSTGAN